MANHASALKRHRQNLKRRAHNRSIKSRLRTERKTFLRHIEAADKESALKQYQLLQKLVSQAAAKGVIHANTSSRIVSRATVKLNAISG